MSKTSTVRISFTQPELWELINCFGASFEEGEDGNELAAHVSEKLRNSYKKFATRSTGGSNHGE